MAVWYTNSGLTPLHIPRVFDPLFVVLELVVGVTKYCRRMEAIVCKQAKTRMDESANDSHVVAAFTHTKP
jgi:hypothetical protein